MADYWMTTLPKLIEEGLAKNPSGIALACKYDSGWKEYSVDEFRTTVAEVAMGLHDLGIRKGDTVGLHSQNCAEWQFTDAAMVSTGVINVPIYSTQHEDQIKYILEHAEVKALLISNAELFEASGKSIDSFPDLHLVGFHGAFHDRMITFEDLRDRGRKVMTDQPDLYGQLVDAVEPQDLASIPYTSGTTGVPKGVMLAHSNLCHSMLSIKDSIWFSEASPDDKILSFLPFAHIFERITAFACLNKGIPFYIVQNTDSLLEDLAYVKPASFSTVPRLLEKIYGSIMQRVESTPGVKGKLARWAVDLARNYDVDAGRDWRHKVADKLVYSKFRQAFGGNIVGITSGGAALSADIARFMIGIGVPVGEGYGLTETSPGLSIYQRDNLKPGSVGKAIPDVEIKIADDGEILCRGPNVMQGYYKNPEATREAIGPDGWFHTGDIGHLDDEGYLYITDRKKELFKLSTGKYVAPAPVENRLVTSAYVEQVAVIGNGEKFCAALIVPNMDTIRGAHGDDVSEDKVRELLQADIDNANEGIPDWETVKKFAILDMPMTVETGELTPTMKRRRKQIGEVRADDIAAIYA